MITITTIKGETYNVDTESDRIYKDGRLIPSTIAEPVYSRINQNSIPTLAGIHLKDKAQIISLSGKISDIVSDINSIV